MNPLALEALRLGTCIALIAGGLGIARSVARSPGARRALARHRQKLALELRLVGMHVDAGTWLVMQASGVAACLAAGLMLDARALGVLVPGILVLPHVWLRRARTRRVARIEEQVDGWLLLLSNALKATPALGEAVASTIDLVDPPLSIELDRVVKEHRLGTPLDDALAGMASRARSRVLSSTVVALRIARRTGGNLHRMLEASATSLRELARVEAVVRTRTAEGRAQSSLVAVLPAPLFLTLDAIDPGFLGPLFESARGYAVLAAAATLWLVAIVWARRIVAVDV